MMQIAGQTVVVTGANHGLGRSLVQALLDRGASKVYAAARNPASVFDDPRVVALALDLLDHETVATAARHAADAPCSSTIEHRRLRRSTRRRPRHGAHRDASQLRRDLRRHTRLCTGPRAQRRWRDRQPPLTALARQRAADGRLLGVQGSGALATQALRPVLAAKNISVHGVYPAGIDTDMLAGIEAPKTAPRQVAEGVLDGLAAGEEDIFPDPNARAMAATWRSDPKAFERALSGA